MNIWPSVDILAQVEQFDYKDLSVWHSELPINALLKPLWYAECGDASDCSSCPNLIRDIEKRVQVVHQYWNPMTVVCWIKENPLVYIEFTPTKH